MLPGLSLTCSLHVPGAAGTPQYTQDLAGALSLFMGSVSGSEARGMDLYLLLGGF